MIFLEIVFGLFSFATFKVTKAVLGALRALVEALGRKKPRSWSVLGPELLRRRLVLPVLMTHAPRWPTHATVAWTSPFDVTERIRVELNDALHGVSRWSIVVAHHPHRQRAAYLQSGVSEITNGGIDVELRPGRYTLNLRAFDLSGTTVLPAIRVDGGARIAASPVSAEARELYQHLPDRRSVFYFVLHGYVHPMLELARYLPRSFVERELLPVGGDPGASYRYGAFRSGVELRVRVSPELAETHDVYFTAYDRSSFPIWWSRLEGTEYLTPKLEADGFYVVRSLPRSGAEETALASEASITITPVV